VAGMLASGHGEYERARELFVQALSAAGDGTRLQARILANLAALSLLADDVESASQWLARAGTDRGQAGDPATGVLLASTEFGIARAQGDPLGMGEAIARMNRATRARITEVGSGHPLALTAVASLAAAEFELASMEESLDSQERAVTVLDVAAHRLAADLGADHPQALACLENLYVADFSLARAHGSPERASRAASTLESISLRAAAALGEGHPQARAAAANAAAARLALEEPQAAEDTWAAVTWFPLPVPGRTAGLAAAGPAEGAPPVLRSETPGGAASFALYERGDAGYWLEVSLAPGVPRPGIVAVRYAVAHEGSRQLLIPVGGLGGGLAVAVVRLPGYAPDDLDPDGWSGAGPLPPGDVPAWDRDTVVASVDAAVTAATVRAWRRLAALLPDGPRRLITGVLDADSA
jgi:hypothetical protein